MVYTEFDYRKILAILKKLMCYVEENSQNEYYLLSIQTFEDKNSDCIKLSELEEGKYKNFFQESEMFSLITAKFYIDKQGPVLSIYIGEWQCWLKSEYDFSLSEKEDFNKIIPELLNLERKVFEAHDYHQYLLYFCHKISIMINSKLQVE